MILAIETSDILCSVAFWAKGLSILEYNLELPRQHSALVGSLVEQGLDFLAAEDRVTKYNRSDIDLVVSSIGPGSFTGLRIGLSFTQGFCAGLNIPLVGISNHQLLAQQRMAFANKIYTMIEARRDEVYLAQHNFLNAHFSEIKEQRITAKNELAQIIPAGAQLICAAGMNLPEHVLEQLQSREVLLNTGARFSANYLAALGQQKMKIYGADDPATLEPMYIRPFAGAT